MANVSVTSPLSNVSVTNTLSNITVTDTESNNQVNVTSTNTTVSVGTTISNVIVSNVAPVSNADVRTRISVENISGFGNLTYDNTVTSNGVIQYTGVSSEDIRQRIQVLDSGGDGSLTYSNVSGTITYTGPSAAEVRAHLSNTAPIEYNSTTGVISLDTEAVFSNTLANNWFTTQTTDNLTEGSTNLYYTEDRVRNNMANTLVGGANITVTPDLANNIITIDGDLTGDIDSVVAGSGLTGGGSSGDVTLNVGAGTGITVNADNVAVDMSAFTTSDLAEGTNLYYTSARANADFDTRLATKTTSDLTEGTNLYYTTDRANAAILDYDGALTPSSLTATGNVEGVTLKGTGALGLVVNGNATIGGNLDVTGNINSETVVDLFVEDRNITMQFGQTAGNIVPSSNSQIFIDRGTEANTYLIWSEADDKWGFSNDGTNVTFFAEDTDGLTEGSTNLYFTNARADARIDLQTGANLDLSQKTTSDLAEGTNLYYTNARANAAFTDSLDNIATEISSTANITTTANVQGSWFIGNVSGTTADFTGNITAGNIIANSVIDTTADITTTGNITGGYIIAGNDAGEEGIFIGDLNGAIQAEIWNASGDTLNKGDIVALNGGNHGDTPDAVLADSGNASLMPGFGVVKNQITANVVGEVVISGKMNYNSHGFTTGAQLYVDGTGTFTETRPTGEDQLVQKIATVTNSNTLNIAGASRTNDIYNVDEGKIILGSTSNVGITVTPDSNFDTTGNAFSLSNTLTDVNSISSETGSNITLKGQANGLVVNKTINSTQSEVTQLDTTGYAIAIADFGAANITTSNVPSILVQVAGTAGTNTMTATLLFGGAFGPLIGGTEDGPGTFAFNIVNSGTGLGPAMTAADANRNLEGWIFYDTTTASTTTALPANAYVTGISGNTITFSENLISSVSYGGGGFSGILIPAAASTTQEIIFTMDKDTGTAGMPFVSTKPRLNNYQFEETLSNVTLDAVSYADSTVDLANVVMRRMVDVETGDNGAIRTPRSVLVGKNLTPDLLSIGEDGTLPATSGLGLVAQYDGKSYGSDVDTTPQLKFLLNQYRENSLTSYTTYPSWTEFLGQTGDANVDLSYLGAPTMAFKVLGGNIDGFTSTQTSDVVGRLQFNPVVLGQATSSDVFHPPASIVARVPGDPDAPADATLANTDMHFQSTYSTSYRNGANTSSGTIPRTFLSSSDGNTIIAAKTDGRIALKPVRDYGDASDSTSFVENRFAHELHDYHTFLSAEFAGTKQGTIITIQPNSGETGGTTDFNYDSKGNATLRLNTNEANGVVKTYWDITNEHIGGNLQISQDGTDKIEIASDQTVFTNIPVLPQHSNTALPTSIAGGMIYVTNGNNKPAYGDGTNWYYYDNTQVT